MMSDVAQDLDAETAAPPLKKSGVRPALIFALKLVVSAALLTLLAYRIDWQAIEARIADANSVTLALAVAALMVGMAVTSQRWFLLMRSLGIVTRRRFALRATFAAWFVGQFMPGTLGADSARLWMLWRAGRPVNQGLQSIVLDRGVALIGVMLLIMASLPHLFGFAAKEMAWSVTAVTGFLGFALLLYVLLDIRMPSRMSQGWLGKANDFLVALRKALRSPAAAIGIGLSLIVHLLSIGAVVLVARGFGIDLGFGGAIGVVATATLLSAIPISINGWGVREGTLVAGFSLIGIGETDAMLISIVYGLGMIVAALPGSLLWFQRWRE